MCIFPAISSILSLQSEISIDIYTERKDLSHFKQHCILHANLENTKQHFNIKLA